MKSMVVSTATLAAALRLPGADVLISILVDSPTEDSLSQSDIICLKDHGIDAWFCVDVVGSKTADGMICTVKMLDGPSGAIFPKGALVVNYGQSGA